MYVARDRDRPVLPVQCSNHSDRRRGLWRNWFILLLVAAALYYLVFTGITYQRYSTVEMFHTRVHSMRTFNPHQPESHARQQTKSRVKNKNLNSDEPVVHRNNNSINMSEQTLVNRGIDIERDQHAEFPLQWCSSIASDEQLGNVTVSQFYRNKVEVGGHYKPQDCRARHRVAILVPFRNREANLAAFLFNLHPFLIRQGLEYRIFVVEQSGDEPFNKGVLFNAGYLESQKYGYWDCMIYHDVDLLPSNEHILYSCPTWPRHMCSSIKNVTESKFPSMFGGVTAMSIVHYRKVNGYSNLYWGWGGEDSDMFWRLRAANIPIMRYSKEIAIYIPLPHSKPVKNNINNKLVKSAMVRYKHDGLNNVQYQLMNTNKYNLYTYLLVNVNPDKQNFTNILGVVQKEIDRYDNMIDQQNDRQ